MLKKSLCLLLALLMAAVVIPVGATASTATVEPLSLTKMLSDGIHMPSNVGGSVNGENGWFVNGSGMTSKLIADPTGVSNNVLHFNRTASGGVARTTYSFAGSAGEELTGKVYVGADFYVSSWSSFEVQILTSNLTPLVRGYLTSSKNWYNNSPWKKLAPSTGEFSTNTWFTLGFLLDTAAGTYDVYLKDAVKTGGVLTKQGTGALLHTGRGVGNVWFDIDASQSSGDFCIDNLTIKTPSQSSIPEDPSTWTVVREEKLTAGVQGTKVHGWEGWTTYGDAATTDMTVKIAEDPTSTIDNGVMRLNRSAVGDGQTQSTVHKTLMNDTEVAQLVGTQKASFRLNAVAAQSSKLAIGLHGTPTTTEGLGTQLSTVVFSGGTITNATSNETETITAAYPTTGWFEVGMVLNTETGNTDVFVNGKQINGVPFSGSAGDLSQVSFDICHDGLSAGSWYVDDIKTATYHGEDDSSELMNFSSANWNPKYQENFQGLLDYQGNALATGNHILNSRKNVNGTRVAFWSIPSTTAGNAADPWQMRGNYTINGTDAYMLINGWGNPNPAADQWCYYNFRPANNEIESVGGKVLVQFDFTGVRSWGVTSQINKYNMDILDKNDKIITQVVGQSDTKSLYWKDSEGKEIGSSTANVSMVVDTSAKKYCVTITSGAASVSSEWLDFNDATADIPAKLRFYTPVQGGDYWNTAKVDNIFVKQWNTYALEGAWTAGHSDDFEWNTQTESIDGTNSWTANEYAVWATEGSDGLIQLNTGATAVKKLEEWVNGPAVPLTGLAAGTIDFKTDGTGTQSFSLMGDASTKLAEVSIVAGKIIADGLELDTVAANEWFTLTLVLNTETGRYWVYKGDQQLNETGIVGTAGTVTHLGLAGTSGIGYVNNLSTGVAESAVYTIRDVVIADSSGQFINKPTAGASITKMKIAKGQDSEDAVAIVAVYKDNALVVAEPVEIAKTYDVGSLVTLPLDLTLPSDSTGEYRLKVLIWNNLSELKPLTVTPYEAADQGVTMFVAGDSIAQTYTPYNHYPMTGYGQTLQSYLNEYVTVSNYAQSGTSTKTFMDQGRLAEILKTGRSGDYLTIQFAHNDQGQSMSIENYTTNLKTYINEARERGINPILVTSPVRRIFTAANIINETNLGDYPTAMRAVAAETDVPLIDLNQRSIALMNEAGLEGTKLIYMHVTAYDERYFKTASGEANYTASQYNKASATQDNTHFSIYGAHLLAQIISEELAELTDWTISGYAMPNKTDPETFKVAAAQ